MLCPSGSVKGIKEAKEPETQNQGDGLQRNIWALAQIKPTSQG